MKALLMTLLAVSVTAAHRGPEAPPWFAPSDVGASHDVERTLSDGPAGPIDGLDGVGYGPCTPGVITLQQEVVFGVIDEDPDRFGTFVLPDPPITFRHFGRSVHTGEIVESDTVICVESSSPKNGGAPPPAPVVQSPREDE